MSQHRVEKRTKHEKGASLAPAMQRRKALLEETGMSAEQFKESVSGAAAVAKGNELDCLKVARTPSHRASVARAEAPKR
jgi:hypothetical protein